MARLKLIRSEEDVTVDLEKGCDYTLGRGGYCSIVLVDQPGVSRQHCRIRYHKKEKVYTIMDLDSANGTFVNGIRITEEVSLKANDELSLGEYLFILFEDDKGKKKANPYSLENSSITHSSMLSASPDDTFVSENIGHFRVIKELGRGGMSTVYLAEDMILYREVALKLIDVYSMAGGKDKVELYKKIFMREARSAAMISHTNIAQIYEANFDDKWFIAMEYIEGCSLGKRLDDTGVLEFQELIKYAYDIVSSLQYAWENYRLVHRDIKPENIMINRLNDVKIVDFGIAKVISQAGQEFSSSLTLPGIPVGTPNYMSPEQTVGAENVDFKSDIFALGATLYELCTGKKAFNDPSPASIYRFKMDQEYLPIPLFRPNIPHSLVKLIDLMLIPDPDQRISSYDEIRYTLRKISPAAIS